MKIGNHDIKHGDRVAFTDALGRTQFGTANGLLLFPTHAVLDMGGRHGTPRVVKAHEILRVTPARP